MRKKHRAILNFFATVFLLGCLVTTGYYLSNNETIFEKFFPQKLDLTDTSKNIINKCYNTAVEGTVLDNIFDFNAKIITFKEIKILHKKPAITENLYLADKSPDFDASLTQIPKFRANSNLLYNNFTGLNNDPNDRMYEASLLNFEINKENSSQKSPYQVINSRAYNRFEGLIKDFRKDKTPITENSRLIANFGSWNKNSNTFFKPSDIKTNSSERVLNLSNPFDSDKNKPISDYKIVKNQTNSSKLKLNIVKDFSKDPLESVITNILIPSGLPNTAANVDAVARGMGLPSGSLGDKISLATSLGLTVQELSNPNTILPSQIVSSINRNQAYIGDKLDINNTTLQEYYDNALKHKYFQH